jgi:hypothetical protein
MIKFAFLDQLFHDPNRFFDRPGSVDTGVFENIDSFSAFEFIIDEVD